MYAKEIPSKTNLQLAKQRSLVRLCVYVSSKEFGKYVREVSRMQIKLFCSATLYQATFIHYYNRFVLYLLSLMIGNINPSAGVNTERYYRKFLFRTVSLISFPLPVSFAVSLSFSIPFLALTMQRRTGDIHLYTSHVCQMSDISFPFPCSLSSRVFHRIKIRYLSKTRQLSRLNYFV